MSYQAKQVQWGLLNNLNSRDEIKLNSLRLQKTSQTQEDSRLAKDYSDAKKAINAQYEYDDPQREVALSEIKDEFEFLKSQGATENAEVEAQIEVLNDAIKKRETWMDSLEESISEEVQKDHNYGYQ